MTSRPPHRPVDMGIVLEHVTVLPRKLPRGCPCGALWRDQHLWIFVDPDKPNATLHARAMLAFQVGEEGIFYLPGDPRWEEAMRCYDEVLDTMFPDDWFSRDPHPGVLGIHPRA